MRKLQIALGLLAAVLIAGWFIQQAAIDAERAERARLLAQKSAAASAPEPSSSPESAAPEQADRDRLELEKLRAESRELRAQIERANARARDRVAANTSAPSTTATDVANAVIRPSEARDVGQNTPTALVETVIWAASHGDTNRMLQLMAFEPGADMARIQKDMNDLRAEVDKSGPAGILTNGPAAVRVLASQAAENNDQWLLTEETHGDGTAGKPERVRIRWTDTGWRLVVGTNGEPIHENVEGQR